MRHGHRRGLTPDPEPARALEKLAPTSSVAGLLEAERVAELPASHEESAAAVGKVQECLGNSWLVNALDAGASDPFSAMVVAEMGLAAAGIAPTGGFVAAGNEAVLATMREGEGEVQAGPHVARALAGSGSPLPGAVLARMESALGHEFGGVRLHLGAEADRAAQEIQARAFAVGRDLFFASGQFSPGTESGDEIIAHELTHVIQSDEGRLRGKSGVSSPHDAEEREADANAARAVDLLASNASPEWAGSPGALAAGEAPATAGADAIQVGEEAAAGAEESAATEAAFLARTELPGANAPPRKVDAPSKGDGQAPPAVLPPSVAGTKPATTVGAAGPAGKPAVGAPGGAAGAAATQDRSLKDLVAVAVGKAPKVVQAASANLKQAETKLPDDPGAVKSRLPELLKARFKPMVDPLLPTSPTASVSPEALAGVIGAIVAGLPEFVKTAGAEAEADAKDGKGPAHDKGAAGGTKPAATPRPAPAAPPAKDKPAAGPDKHEVSVVEPDIVSDKVDDTTHFFVVAIAEALAALCPPPAPGKEEDETIDPVTGAVVKTAAGTAKQAVKAPAATDEKADPKARADERHQRKQALQWEIEGLKDDEERITRTRDEVSGKVAATQAKILATTTEMETRRAYLEHRAAVAKKAGKKAPPLKKDGRLRLLEHDAGELPKDVERLKAEMERVEKQLAAATEKREKDEEALRALEAELAAGHGGGGGGGGMAPPTDLVATSKAVLDELQPKEKKLSTEADKAKSDWEKLKKEVEGPDGLTEKVKKGDEEMVALQKKKAANVSEVTRLEGLVKSREKTLNTPKEDGSPGPGTSGDTLLADYRAGISKARAANLEINKQIAALGRDLKTWKDQLKAKQIALEVAEEKKTATEKAVTNFGLAVKSLGDKLGCMGWQQIANDYHLHVKAVPLAPGMVRDENGALVKEADLKKKKADEPPKTKEQKDKEEADRLKKKAEDDAAEAKLPKAERDRRDAEKKKKEEQQFLQGVSCAKDLPKGEREIRLQEIADAQKPKKTVAQVEAMYKTQIKAVTQSIPAGMTLDEAKKKGLEEQFKLSRQETDRQERQAKAIAVLGFAKGDHAGEDAVDALWKQARERGIESPDKMLKHLAYVNPKSLPVSMQDAAVRAQAAEAARIAGLTPEARKLEEDNKEGSKARDDAAKAEVRFTKNKELGLKLDCSPEEAALYIKSIAGSAGTNAGDEDAAREALMQADPKKKSVPPLSMDDVARKLKDIHLMPIGAGRQAALLQLAQDAGDPKMLAGASLQPDHGDGTLIDKKQFVASPVLKAQLDAIDKLPPDKQWDAMCSLSRLTKIDPNDLARSRANLAKKNDVVRQVTDIESSDSIPPAKKTELIAEIAAAHKLSTDDIRKFAQGERAKTGTDVLEAAKRDPDLQKQLDALKLDSKSTPQQKELALKDIARRTGIDPEALADWNNVWQFRMRRQRYKEQFKSASDDEASTKVAGLIEQYGSMDAAKDQLRNCRTLSPEMQKLRDGILEWDKDNPGREVAPKLLRVDPGDKEYQKKRDALMKELSPTRVVGWVSDEKAYNLLNAMSTEEITTMMKERPEVFAKFFKGVDGDSKYGKMAKGKFGPAVAYQFKLDAETVADDAKAADAAKVEMQVETVRKAADKLKMPFGEARANLQAVAEGKGMTPQQALTFLEGNGKTPAEGLKNALAEVPPKGSKETVNPILKARLQQIDRMPAKERSAALKGLKDTAGIDDDAMDVALTAARRDTGITADLHALRDLPKTERDAALKDLVKKYKVKDVDELEAVYKGTMERTAVRMKASGLTEAAILPATLSTSPADIDKHIKDLARQTGQSEDAIRKLVEARRTSAFDAGASKMLGGDDSAAAFKKAAYDANMSPSEYADWLARSPKGVLKGEQADQRALLDSGRYQIVRSEGELAEMKKAVGVDPADPAFRTKSAGLLAELQSGHEDKDILALYGQMTPGEQKLFKQEFEASGKGSLEAAFRHSLDGDDVERGVNMLRAADKWDEKKNTEEAFAAVDTKDANYQVRINELGAELAKGDKADAGRVGQMLMAMPLNQRAAFLREYQAGQAAAAQAVDASDLNRQKYLPVNLSQLLADNGDALGALNQGLRLKEASTPQKDAERARRVQESITIGREAADTLGVDQRTGFRLVDGLARDSGLSPSNALLWLQGKPVKLEADTRSPFVQDMVKAVQQRALAGKPLQMIQAAQPESTDRINGQGLDGNKVKATVGFFTDGKDKSDAAIVAMIQGCNPRELADIDRKLQAGTPSRTLADVTKDVTGKDKKEVGPLLRGMQDYKDTESHYQLIGNVKKEDPRSHADVGTPEGFAEKLQWCKDLPPDLRMEELNKLRAEGGGTGAGHFGAQQVMAAWLNGPQGKGADPYQPHMLSSAMSSELDAIDRLPSQEARDAALKNLAVLTGRWHGTGAKTDMSDLQAEFKGAREHTADGMKYGKRVQEIEEMPEDQRAQAMLDLSKSSNLSIDALHGLHEEALKSGLVAQSLKTVTPDQAKRLAEIRGMGPKEQAAAIQEFEKQTGLNPRDINAHLQTDLEATQKKMAERNRAQTGADALKDRITAGDTAGVKKQLQEASGDPAEFKRILDAYSAAGGSLERDLRVLYGDTRVAQASPLAYLVAGESLGGWTAEHDIDYRLITEMVKTGKDFEQAPDLPSGISPLVSDEVRRIKMNLPESMWQNELDTLKAQKGISDEDFAIVQKHAEVNQRMFEKAVESKMRLLDAEKTDDSWAGRHLEWVDDAHVSEIGKGITPEMMAEINKRRPGLVQNIQAGIDGNVKEDFDYNLNLGNKLANLPEDEHQKVASAARVDHKAEQLQQEFDAWFEDKGRIKELLKDCSTEELKALNDRFGGKLQEKIDKANEPSTLGAFAAGAGLVGLSLLMGPLVFAVGAVALGGASCDEKDPEWMAVRMRLKDATCDPKAPYKPNDEAIAKARKALEGEFGSLWTRDSTCLAALKGLSPRDLATLQEQYNRDHGPGALEAALRKDVSGDDLVKSISLLRDAEDAASGIDRGQQMKDTIRQMAIKEVMADLKKDPKNSSKTDSELYEMAEKDEAKVTDKAKEKQKKISDGANSIFKAVDGWGDDEAAVQKTLAGLSVEEIELVRIEYRRHFGRDLDTHLSEDIGGKDLEVMQKLMNKDTRVEGLQKYVLTMSGIDDEHEDYFSSYGGLGEDEEGIYAAFQAMSPEERTKVVSGPGGAKFLARVKLNLGSNEAAVVDALTEINPDTGVAEANPAHVAASKIQLYTRGSGDWDFWSGWGTKEEELVKELDKLTPEQVQEASRWYEQKYGEPLAAVLADELGTDTREFAICDAELRGDKVEADVHRLKWAAQDENSSSNWLLAATGPLGMLAAGGLSAAGVKLPVLFSGTDEELLEATLKGGKEKRGGRDAEHLEKVKARFNKMFAGGDLGANDGTGRSPLDRLIDNETSGVEKAYFTQLAAKGEADPEVELLYSMDGLGTDEERAKKVMERVYDMSSDERAAFKHRFATVGQSMYGGAQSLDEWIDGDFSGTEGFEMKLKLRGKPEKPEDFLEIARMRWEFERGGAGNAFMNSFMDGLESLGATSAGEVFANDTARIYEMFDEKGQLRPGVSQDKLEEVAGWQTQTALNYRETRDSITDAVVNTVQVVGAVVIAVVPGLQGVSAMIIANIVLAAATMALKAAMKGNGYGWEEGLMDLAQAAVTVATAGMGAELSAAGNIAVKEGEVIAGKIGAYALKLADKFGAMAEKLGGRVAVAKAISTMMTESIQNGVQGFLNAALSSEEAMRQGDGAFFQHLLGGAVGGALQGAATAGLKGGVGKTGFGKAIEEAKEVGSKAGIITKMGAHFANGLISSTLQTATDYNQWEAWAAGKGLDAATLRGAFLQGIAESVMGTGFENAIKKQHIDQAHQEIRAGTTRMNEIQTALKADLPAPERVALQKEHAEIQSHIHEQTNIIARMEEVDDSRKKHEQAREEVEQKISKPSQDKEVDPRVDKVQVEAVKLVLEQTETTPLKSDAPEHHVEPVVHEQPLLEKAAVSSRKAAETSHPEAVGPAREHVEAARHVDGAQASSERHVELVGGKPVEGARPVEGTPEPVRSHVHDTGTGWNGHEPEAVGKLDKVSRTFAALDQEGRLYDLRDLHYRDGTWKTSAGAEVPHEVAAQANDRRKVELHQHFRGILPAEDLAVMLGESALRVRGESERVLAAGGKLTPEQQLVHECFKPGEAPAIGAMKWLEKAYAANSDNLRSGDDVRARREAVGELNDRVAALRAELRTAPPEQVSRIGLEILDARDQLENHRLRIDLAEKSAAPAGGDATSKAEKAAGVLKAQQALDEHSKSYPDAAKVAAEPGPGPLKRQMDDPVLHSVDSQGNLTPSSARAKLDALLSAGHDNPFDATYDPRGLMIAVITGSRDFHGAKVAGGAKPEHGEQFLRATLEHLRRDGIDYAEPQGNWHKDLGLTPADMGRIGREEGVELRFLPHRVSENELALKTVPESRKSTYKEELNTALRAGTAPGGTEFHSVAAGFDFCGPEGKPFQPEGMKHLQWAYEVLLDASKESGKRMVLRPHVGEGYTETYEQRTRGVSEAQRQGAEYSHQPPGANAHPSDIARHNLQMVIDQVSSLKEQGLYDPRFVTVRLGHVTNIDPQQAKQLHALGIIAEVNLGSNVSTGALRRMEGGESRLTGHPMLDLMAARVDTVLSTDAHAVMNTDLSSEFKAAKFLLDQFHEGKAGVTYNGHERTSQEMPSVLAREYQEAEFKRTGVRVSDADALVEGARQADHMFSIDRLHEAAQKYRGGVNDPLPAKSESTGPRSVAEAQGIREEALGSDWKRGVEEAKRGLATAEPGSLAHDGFSSRLMDLDRISRISDPSVAQAEFKAVKVNDAVAVERPAGRANSADLKEARTLLSANPNAEMEPHHAMALLDHAMDSVRVQSMEQTGLGAHAVHEPVNQIGMADSSQRRVAAALGAMGVSGDDITFHQGAGGVGTPAQMQHAFTVAKMPDGRLYLIDPNFGAHLATGHDSVGRRLVSDPHGEAVARGLKRDGYVVLDDATARAYGKAITGEDGQYSAASFSRPNGIKAHAEAGTVSSGDHAARTAEYHTAFAERPSRDPHAATKEALGMHHSEWASNPEAQKALFTASAEAVTRMRAMGAEVVHGMEGAEVSSLRKRDDFHEFVTEVQKKQQAEGYEHVGKMCDIVRGRFNLATGADVELVVARLKERYPDAKVKPPRDGYPRWHINVQDGATGLVHEWQIGTKATTDFFETRALSIPAGITAFKGKPDFHDGVYKLLNKVKDPELRTQHGIDEMLPHYKALAEATGRVTKGEPLPERYAEGYHEMTLAINQKLAAIEAEHPGYMNKVLNGEPTPAITPRVAEASKTPTATVPAGGTPAALAHAVVPPIPAVVAPPGPIGVRGYLAERDKLGRMAFGGGFQYDLHDSNGVSEARMKVHLAGDGTTNPAVRDALRAKFATMTDAEIEHAARVEGQNHDGQAAKSAGMELARRRMLAGVEQFFNAPHFEVPGPDGKPSRLRVAIEFVDDPAQAHHTVHVSNGNELGQAFANQVQTFTTPMIHAHEAGHAIFGLLDEYADHVKVGSQKPEGRRHAKDSRVVKDQSLYAGGVRKVDPADPTRELRDPTVRLQDRHIEQIREQIREARAIAARGWTPQQLDALVKGPAQFDEWQTRRMAPTQFHDEGSVQTRRLRLAEKMTPEHYSQAMANGWNNAELQSGPIRQIAHRMTAAEFATAQAAGWTPRQLAKADAVTLLDAGQGTSRAQRKAAKAPVPTAPAVVPTAPAVAPAASGHAGPAAVAPTLPGHAGPVALAHAVVPPTPATTPTSVAPQAATGPSAPIGVRGFLAERDKLGRMAFGGGYQYDLHDGSGVSEARLKVHLAGDASTNPAVRDALRAKFATMTDAQIEHAASVEGQNRDGQAAKNAGMELARRRMLAGVEQFFNAPQFEVPGPDGKPSRLRVAIEFVDDPAQAHHTVHVSNGNELGQAFADQVQTFTTPMIHAHEAGHAIFGLLDEYADHVKVGSQKPEGRRHANDSRVVKDQSLYAGGVRKVDPADPTRELRDPTVGLQERHIEQIREQIREARAIAARGWTPEQLDALVKGPAQFDEWQTPRMAPTEFHDEGSVQTRRLRIAEKMTPENYSQAMANGWNNAELQSGPIRQIAHRMTAAEFATAQAAGWTPRQLSKADEVTLFGAGQGLSRIQRKVPVVAAVPVVAPAGPGHGAAAVPHVESTPVPHTTPVPHSTEAVAISPKDALAMHHSEWAGHMEAQKALFEASSGAVSRMKAAGAEIVQGMPGADVSSLRKRDNFEQFVSEIVKKQKNENYEHVGKMCDIVRGRFNVETGADVQTVVARLKEKFGDDVVKVKEPREGYPRWHINVRDAQTGLVHEWQVGTKSTTQFFETKSLTIPETITAFKGQPDFHDGVYKLLNKVTDPEVRARHGIDTMLPEYKQLAEETGRVTTEKPVPERHAERYAAMTRAINEKLAAIERENPGYMNAVLKGEPTPTPAPPKAEAPIGSSQPAASAPAASRTMAGVAGGEVAAMHEFEGRVLVQYKNGAMQWMEKAEAANFRVAQATPGVVVSGPNDKTIPPVAGANAKTLPMTPQGEARVAGQNVGVPDAPRAVQKTLPMTPEPQQAVQQQRVVQQQAVQPQRVQQAAVPQQQAAPVKPGSRWAAEVQRVYANGSNTEFVHVDLQNDTALRRQLDRAHAATAAGASLDQKLALLSAHVKDGITYDMAAQQHEYQAHSGQVSLGTMIEQGSVVCREKALFTHAALAEMGIASKVVVGTVPDGNGRTGGHAWVELADGTIIDGTWGRIFPAGNDPVQGRTRRSATTFAEPRVELPSAQAISASRSAAAILSNPQEMDRMRRPAQASPEELLVRPGVRAWHPDGRTPVTVEYSERDKVQVRHDDGRVEILSRAAFVNGNGWALQPQGGQQQAGQQRRTHTMAAYEPHPDVDAAGPDEKALKLMDARSKNHDLDHAVHTEVESKTRSASGGHSYVDETYENVTVGAGFAGISNEVGQRAAGKSGKRLVIGEENPWLGARADLGQPAGGSEVDGGRVGMKQSARTADERFMHAREHAENAEINRADAGVGLFKKQILGVEVRPEPVDARTWHRPDAKARIAVLEGHTEDGSPIIRYVYARRIDIASGPGPARKLADKAVIRGRGPVPENMDPAEFDRLAREGKIIPRQIDPDLYRELVQQKRILQSDQAFDPANVEHGDHVLVYGGGASAAWGVEGATPKAGKVEWLGRMAKPGDDLTNAQNTRLKQHYADLEAAHAAHDPLAVERSMRAIEHFTFTEAPNNGFLPRNLRDGGAFDPEQQAEHGGKITRDVLPDLASVTREAHPETGKSMIRVEGTDGSVRWCDRLVLAIGQDGNGLGGPAQLLEKVPVLRPLVDPSASDWGFPVVVGLQTPDSAIRVLGVAATSPVLRHKIESGTREFVEQSFALQAHDKGTVPLDSQGVIGSFHHAERMIRAANKAQLMDLASQAPEEQAKILGVHHGRWRTKRAADELRTRDAPEMPQPSAK